MADQRPIGFWLRLVDRLIDERFASVLDEHGVTRRQWQLLTILDRGPATADELDAALAPFLAESAEGEESGLAESSVDHLTELIDSGWVAATTSAYELTEHGGAVYERLRIVVAGIRDEVTAGLTEDEYRATIETLERMARNLGWDDER